MNSIFSECDTLFSFSDNIEPELDKNLITEFNQLNIENIQTYDLISNTDTNDFYTESSSLSINQSFKKKSYERNYKINDIKNKGLLSYLQIYVTKMNYMFLRCNSLISLPDLSNWNISKVKSLSGLFFDCSSLISLPDISKWNTSNVKDMSFIFYQCKSLISIPDISKWDTSNVLYMNHMFCGCYSLDVLPNISKWNIINCINIKHMFFGCKPSLNLPNIFLWKIPFTFDINKNYNIFLEIKYKPDNDNKSSHVRIFGERFVAINRDDCKIIYKNKSYELTHYFEDIDKNYNHKDFFKFILCLDNNITSLSYMFSLCSSLISISEKSIWDCLESNKESNDKNLNGSKSDDSEELHHSIHNYFPISNIQLNEITDMSYLFFGCSSLISLPDIIKLNTSKVKNMSYMFYGCSSLISLPDISLWDTSNVLYMNNMFDKYSKLIVFPYISKWNISNVKDISYLFSECNSLMSFPNISKWKTLNVQKMSNLFNGIKILSLPNISKWDTSNIKDISFLFNGCEMLTSIPDIAKWNTSKVENISGLFKGCESLISLPNISKWNTKNVTVMNSIFCDCEQLLFMTESSFKLIIAFFPT